MPDRVAVSLGTLRGEVVELPEAAQVRAEYRVAVIREAPHAEEARAFVAYLVSPVASELLQRHGFGAP